MIKFKTAKGESALIAKIVARCMREHPHEFVEEGDQLSLHMDITACHLNGCPLDLPKLLAAPTGVFGHDVFGIRRFIDRSTGKIDPAKFDPRCALPAHGN